MSLSLRETSATWNDVRVSDFTLSSFFLSFFPPSFPHFLCSLFNILSSSLLQMLCPSWKIYILFSAAPLFIGICQCHIDSGIYRILFLFLFSPFYANLSFSTKMLVFKYFELVIFLFSLKLYHPIASLWSEESLIVKFMSLPPPGLQGRGQIGKKCQIFNNLFLDSHTCEKKLKQWCPWSLLLKLWNSWHLG